MWLYDSVQRESDTHYSHSCLSPRLGTNLKTGRKLLCLTFLLCAEAEHLTCALAVLELTAPLSESVAPEPKTSNTATRAFSLCSAWLLLPRSHSRPVLSVAGVYLHRCVCRNVYVSVWGLSPLSRFVCCWRGSDSFSQSLSQNWCGVI